MKAGAKRTLATSSSADALGFVVLPAGRHPESTKMFRAAMMPGNRLKSSDPSQATKARTPLSPSCPMISSVSFLDRKSDFDSEVWF